WLASGLVRPPADGRVAVRRGGDEDGRGIGRPRAAKAGRRRGGGAGPRVERRAQDGLRGRDKWVRRSHEPRPSRGRRARPDRRGAAGGDLSSPAPPSRTSQNPTLHSPPIRTRRPRHRPSAPRTRREAQGRNCERPIAALPPPVLLGAVRSPRPQGRRSCLMAVRRSRPSREILSGESADVYFARADRILDREGLDPVVTMEVFGRRDAVLCGIDEVKHPLGHVLATGDPAEVTVEALEDGDAIAPKEIVLRITARYRAFGLYETAILGMLAQSTGWATA